MECRRLANYFALPVGLSLIYLNWAHQLRTVGRAPLPADSVELAASNGLGLLASLQLASNSIETLTGRD